MQKPVPIVGSASVPSWVVTGQNASKWARQLSVLAMKKDSLSVGRQAFVDHRMASN